jgi:hypothetical protein
LVELHPDFDERGLLGLAYHPEFVANGRFYVARDKARRTNSGRGSG